MTTKSILNKLRNLSAVCTGLALLLPALASAHVIVTPSQAGIGTEQLFNVSSPNEQQTPIVKVTLNIPNGVTAVVPTEKEGWTINTTTSGNGSAAMISSITWGGSQIPVGERTDFGFAAQVPATATNLDWKAYQTYANGTVVHWDQIPAGSDDAAGNAGPFSVTKVVNDLTPATTRATTSKNSNTPTLIVALLALVISVAAVLRPTSSRKRKP
jgi:uncharacterized protein YcnI